jgi:GT2 family glycosyltransferase
MSRSDIAVVVIGRNEGARLDLSLRSTAGLRAVYVDSGSSDGSVQRAKAAGVEVIELDSAEGFTAARGRNAGLERLIADLSIVYIQMLDGDCTLDPDWIARGAAALDADPGLGGVFGIRREARPEASIYAWLFDVEWTVQPGPAQLFGGDVLLRAEAVRQTGLYRPDMIAGEDHDYAVRLRAVGWRLLCLATPMTTHDAATTRFRGWWRRSIRAGHAFAELSHLHRHSPQHDFTRSRFRILLWGAAVPFAALAGLLLALTVDRWWIVLSVAALLLVAAQLVRVALRTSRRHPPGRAFALALFLGVGKYAEMAGLIRFHIGRRCGRLSRLIEYKTR